MSKFAYAENDKLVLLAENDTQTMYGVKGTMTAKGQFRILWTTSIYKKDGAKNSFTNKKLWAGVENKQKWIIDCESGKVKSLMFIVYNKTGATIYSEGPGDVIDIVPGSMAEAVAKVACYTEEEEPKTKISQPF